MNTSVTEGLFCSFIVSFSFHSTDAENDSRKLQDFLMRMKTDIMEHPLWIHCTDEEIDSAVEVILADIQVNHFSVTVACSLFGGIGINHLCITVILYEIFNIASLTFAVCDLYLLQLLVWL